MGRCKRSSSVCCPPGSGVPSCRRCTQVSSEPDQSGLVPLGQWHGWPACERLVVELLRVCTPHSLYSFLSVPPAELLRSVLAMFSPCPVPGVLVFCARDLLSPWPLVVWST